ncbi:hypothetical protein T492DRAFT_843197 [Pavlovales sp. CCMP2436]|nr:hypothetical protein T492DRAFT_843197 [Pavlovales sp. CCMP2436]
MPVRPVPQAERSEGARAAATSMRALANDAVAAGLGDDGADARDIRHHEQDGRAVIGGGGGAGACARARAVGNETDCALCGVDGCGVYEAVEADEREVERLARDEGRSDGEVLEATGGGLGGGGEHVHLEGVADLLPEHHVELELVRARCCK